MRLPDGYQVTFEGWGWTLLHPTGWISVPSNLEAHEIAWQMHTTNVVKAALAVFPPEFFEWARTLEGVARRGMIAGLREQIPAARALSTGHVWQLVLAHQPTESQEAA